MDQIIQNLSFEVVAVPQQNAVPTTASHTTPIKVKIKMKKGDNKGTRQEVIFIPKMKPTNSDLTRTVHSDETIMSFNIHMKSETESKPRRKPQKQFFHLFKTGKCIDTQGEDENDPPYMLATPIKSNEVKSEHVLLELRNKNETINMPKYKFNIKTAKDFSKSPNIFGKCKPGGCLDPPFGEDNYNYYPSHQKGKEVENGLKPFIENTHENKKDSKNCDIPAKNLNATESDVSSTYTLYKANSQNEILNEKYSDSIITYPTRTSSKDLSILEKNVVSRISSSVRNKQLNTDTYFTPTKMRKSQERKSESLNKRSTDRKNSHKEEIKSNLSCNIPKEQQDTVLLQDSSKNIGHENVKKESQELMTESNYNLTQLVEISGNILVSVNQIKKPIISLKSKSDEPKIKSEREEVNDRITDDTNMTENITLKSINVMSNEASIFDIQKSSSLESFKEPQKINRLPPTISNILIPTKEQIFNKGAFENNQAHDPTLNYNEQVKKLSHMESPINSAKLLFIDEEHHNEVKNIASPNKLNIKDREESRNLYGMIENVKNELPIHCLDKTKENVTIEKLPNIEKNEDKEFIFNVKKPNEQFTTHVTDVSSGLNVDELNNRSFSIQKDSAVKPTIEFDDGNSVYKSDYLTEKKSLSNNLTTQELKNIYSENAIRNNRITGTDNEIKTLKVANNTANLNTSDDNDVIKRESLINIEASTTPFSAVRTSLDFASVKDDIIILPMVNTTNKSNDKLLQNVDIITLRNIPQNDNITKFDKPLSRESISNVIHLKNVASSHSENTLSAMLNNKNVMYLASADEINKNTDIIEHFETKFINKEMEIGVQDVQASIKPERSPESENILPSKNISNELPLISLVPNHIEYTLLDTMSSSISNSTNKVYKKEYESATANKSHNVNNDIMNDANILRQNILRENFVPDFGEQEMNMVNENMLNKSNLIETAKHLEPNNYLGILNSEQNLINTLDKSSSGLSDEPTISDVKSSNTKADFNGKSSLNINTIRKEGFTEVPLTLKMQQSNKFSENENIKTKEKEDVTWMTLTDTKKRTSKISLKTVAMKTIAVDLGFQSYVNENGETIIKTFDTSQELQRFSQDKIFVTTSEININDSKLVFAINSDIRLSIKVDTNTNSSEERSNKVEGTHAHGSAHSTNRNIKISKDVSDINTLQETLSAIYVNDLIPIEKLIRSLRLEIDRIDKYRQLMRKKSLTASKKLKPIYSKRCVCIRK